MSAPSNPAVLDRVLDPVKGCLTPDVARKIVGLRASDEVQRRIDELADKSGAGGLTDAERAEYETWVRAINFVGILQAKARKVAGLASP